MLLAVCSIVALVRAAIDPRRLGETLLIAAAASFLAASWLYARPGVFALYGLALSAIGIAATYVRGRPRPQEPPGAPASWGWAVLVIAIATALKLVELAEFPAHLNAYSAETGWWGILTLDGHWPKEFWRGHEYDLVNGGRSPLHLPLTWATVRAFGGNVYAVRFAEVLASTILLLVFFGWLRERVRGGWSVAALATFALSPWHLAQSRMGTFFSASVALGLALLWAGDRIDRAERTASLLSWATFGFFTGLIGYAYTPLKVLYAFFAVVWLRAAIAAWRHRAPGWWRGPALALAIAIGLLAVQVGWPPRFDEMFRRDYGPLATDTSVWHKTATDEVTVETQPVAVAARNVWRNLVAWWVDTWNEDRILVWYAPALVVTVLLALLMLWRADTWVPACYVLIGTIPPLMIYPVQRRTLVLWPLVYVTGVIAGRELASTCARLFAWPRWGQMIRGAFLAFWVIASAHGLAVYAGTNSLVGVGSYFAPDHELDMLNEAERLLPSCRVYFVNATFEDKMIASVRLFEPARRLGGEENFGFVDYSEGDGEPDVPRDRPLCFLLMSQEEGEDVAPLEATMRNLGQWFSGNMLLHRWAADGSDTIQYLVLMTGPPPAPDEDPAQDAILTEP